MSRRFGRNQKRRMRAEIQALQEAHVREAGLLRHMSNRLSDLRAVMADVVRVVGPHFIALEPEIMEQILPPNGYLRMPVRERMNEMLLRYEHGEAEAQVLRFVNMLVYHAASWADDMRHMQHFAIVSPKGEVAYAVSETALQSAPPEILARNIVQALGKEIEQRITRGRA